MDAISAMRFAMVLALNVEAMAMHAANEARKIDKAHPAYNETDFFRVSAEMNALAREIVG